MKSIKNRTLILVMIAVILAFISNISYAASGSYTISVGSKSIKVGDSTTLTISVNNCEGQFSISSSDSSVVSVGSQSVWAPENSSIKLTAKKAGTATITVTPKDVSDTSEKAVTGARTVTVSVTGTDSKKTETTKNEETQEPTFKSTNETVYSTGNVNVRKSYTADSDKIDSLTKGQKLTRTGVGDNGWSKVSYDGSVGYVKSSLLTTEEPKKSDDKSLKSLSIEGVELSPEFDPETTDYSAIVDNSVEKIEIQAEVNDENAKKEITGNEGLKEGENLVKITVTAEDETARIYTINVTRQPKKTIALSSLKINGYTLNPKFSPDIAEYKVTILDSNVTSLDISATTDVEDAKVEITGNTNIKNGDNVILINVTSKDETQKTTYKIIANKSSAALKNNDSSNNWILYAGIGIIVFLVIAIVAVIVISKRRAQYEDEEEYDDNESENQNKEDYSDLYGGSTKQELGDNENIGNTNISDEYKKELDTNESIYGDFSAKANSERMEAENNKYNYDYSGEKDVNYYNNKFSELFDTQENKLDKTSQDAFGYLSNETDNMKENNEYTYNEEDYKPRRSKGKHSK